MDKSDSSDSDLIVRNPTLMEDIRAALEDLENGREYTHEEMITELERFL
jgi:hypothetical protein